MDPTMIAAQPAPAGGAPGQPSTPAAAPAAPEGTPPGTPPAPGGEPSPEAFKPAYHSQLSGELQKPEIFAKLAKAGGPNIDHLASGFISVSEQLEQAKASEEALKARVALPGKDAKPEEWDPVWSALGWPKTKDEYKFDRTGELAELPKLPGLDEKIAEIFHNLRAPKSFAESFFKEQSKLTVGLLKEMRDQREQAAVAGKKEFEKLAGRGYDEAVADLGQTAKVLFGEEDWKLFLDSPLANRPGFMMKMIGLKKAMSDSAIVTGGGAPGQTEPQTPKEALKQALA